MIFEAVLTPREILFKALDTGGTWIEGILEYAYADKHTPLITDVHLDRHQIIVETLCQFTGKLDKNKRKVFEGDICVGRWPSARKGLVRWDPARCGFYIKPIREDGSYGRARYDYGYKMNANKFEVVGSIHDDKERK